MLQHQQDSLTCHGLTTNSQMTDMVKLCVAPEHSTDSVTSRLSVLLPETPSAPISTATLMLGGCFPYYHLAELSHYEQLSDCGMSANKLKSSSTFSLQTEASRL